MENNELPGTLALVHPYLENDPSQRQGQIGIVTYIDDEKKEVYLSFEQGPDSAYQAADLFQLKPKDRLFPELTDKASTLSITDFKDLYKIGLLQDRGRGVDQWQALEIARENPGIWESVLLPVGPGLAATISKNPGR
jgi:hypothetical protein